jgi:hypothetical protein
MSSARRRLIAIVSTFVALAAVGGTVWALDDDGGDSATAATAATSTTAAPATTTSTTVAAHNHEHDAMDASECVVAGVQIHPPAHTEHPGMTVHDATGAASPTADDCAHAQAFYAQVSAAAVRYADIDAATADGYVAGPRAASNGRPVDHYFLRGRDPAVLDATKPEGLVYWVDGDTATLLGVLFMEHDDANLQLPGGPYTLWDVYGGAVKLFEFWVLVVV